MPIRIRKEELLQGSLIIFARKKVCRKAIGDAQRWEYGSAPDLLTQREELCGDFLVGSFHKNNASSALFLGEVSFHK